MSACSNAMASRRARIAAGSSRGAGRRQVAQVDQRVALARDALVQLDDRLLHPGSRRPHLGEGRRRRRPCRAGPRGPADGGRRRRRRGGGSRSSCRTTAPGGRRRRAGCRGRARGRARARRRERDEVAELRVRDARPDGVEHARALQQLRRERPRRAVAGRHQVQPGAGVRGDHARQQRQVVVDDALVDRPAGDEDQVQPRLAQQQQQEEHPLLVDLDERAGRRRVVGRDRRHDDERLARQVQPHGAPAPGRGAAAGGRSARAARCSLSSLSAGSGPARRCSCGLRGRVEPAHLVGPRRPGEARAA